MLASTQTCIIYNKKKILFAFLFLEEKFYLIKFLTSNDTYQQLAKVTFIWGHNLVY